MEWLRRIPRPVFLFVGITFIFLSSLAWLSWRVIAQDRAVERQRWLELCEAAARNAASQLTRQLADLQHMLADAAEGRPTQVPVDGIAILIFRNEFLEAQIGSK